MFRSLLLTALLVGAAITSKKWGDIGSSITERTAEVQALWLRDRRRHSESNGERDDGNGNGGEAHDFESLDVRTMREISELSSRNAVATCVATLTLFQYVLYTAREWDVRTSFLISAGESTSTSPLVAAHVCLISHTELMQGE